MICYFLLSFNEKQDMYKVLSVNYKDDIAGIKDKDLQIANVTKQELLTKYKNTNKRNNPFINFEFEKTKTDYKVKTKMKPFKGNYLIAISQIVDENNFLMGYRVADKNGVVKKIHLKELLALGIEAKKKGVDLMQDLILVSQNVERPYYRIYEGGNLLNEVVKRNIKNKVDKVEAVINKNESKMKDLYTKEQLLELSKGKESGINYKVYANPKYTSEQMRFARETMEKGFSVKEYLHPSYDVKTLKLLRVHNEIDDVSKYANPKFSGAQLAQIALAYENGLDIKRMYDEKLSVEEMIKIRRDMEDENWLERQVKTVKKLR